MMIDIIFMDKQGDKIARVNMCMSNFESIFMDFGFEGHSKDNYWDYDEYGYVKDKALTTMLWYGCVKQGYISEDHSLVAKLAPITQFVVQ